MYTPKPVQILVIAISQLAGQKGFGFQGGIGWPVKGADQ